MAIFSTHSLDILSPASLDPLDTDCRLAWRLRHESNKSFNLIRIVKISVEQLDYPERVLKRRLVLNRIVYCKDANRRGEHEHTAFTFLGFTFRARPARAKDGALFASFQPAVSKQALKKISGEVRRWRLHRWIGLSIAEIARQINPVVRGWMQYYGAFYRSALHPVLQRINAYLMRWLRDKHKRLRPIKKAKAAWQRIISQDPRLFAHWAWASASWWTG